jgi:hypothetical protein
MRSPGLALAAALVLASAPTAAVDENVHERCIKAADYKGCVDSQGKSKAEDQITTGILWDTAEWKTPQNIVRIKVYRMRGGGLWVGNAMRLSVMEVDCDRAEFDVESDGYRKQSIEGDAYRQAPLIFSRLCTKPISWQGATT